MIVLVIFTITSCCRITHPFLAVAELGLGFPDGPGILPFRGSSADRLLCPSGVRYYSQGAAVGAGALSSSPSSATVHQATVGRSPGHRMKGFTLPEDQAMCLALLAGADVAGTQGEALGPETVADGSQALGFTLRLDLRRELVPRQWYVSGLGPQPQPLLVQAEPKDSCMSPIWARAQGPGVSLARSPTCLSSRALLLPS